MHGAPVKRPLDVLVRYNYKLLYIALKADKSASADFFPQSSPFDNNYINQQKKEAVRDFLFLLVRAKGLASLEPPAKQSTGLFFRLSANTQLKLLAPNSSPFAFITTKKSSYQTFRFDSNSFGASKGTCTASLKVYSKLLQN